MSYEEAIVGDWKYGSDGILVTSKGRLAWAWTVIPKFWENHVSFTFTNGEKPATKVVMGLIASPLQN